MSTQPVKGYTPQSPSNVDAVNRNNELEERVLRQLASLTRDPTWADVTWLRIAKEHIEIGFMCMNRAVLQPERIKLPED